MMRFDVQSAGVTEEPPLQGRYRLLAPLGRGGLGQVFEAEDLQQRRRVAIKQMHLEAAEGPYGQALRRQFSIEAAILKQVSHPGLPQVYDFFEANGKPYLVMEMVVGEPLGGVRVPEPTVLAWAGELCSILEVLHGHAPPIVFRDLKPSNVLLGADGHLHLVDFGLAKIGPAGERTATGAKLCASHGYAPPEQYHGVTGPDADVYALGATLYALLSGSAPPGALDRLNGADLQPLDG